MGAVIFCSGIINDYDSLKKRDFSDELIICADGGVRHTNELGLCPNVIIGDNDSWREEYPDVAEVYEYPRRKNFTDTQLCIDYAIEHGYYDIEILGGFGGRHDHEYSHYCLMEYALERDVRVVMKNENNCIWMEKTPFVLEHAGYKYVSFFAYGGSVEEFSVKGLKYTADNMLLKSGLVQATSNEFVEGETAEISFKSGTLLVMLCDDM